MSRPAYPIFVIVFLSFALSGCDNREFNLPRGDVEAGRATFVLLQCNECHYVEGVQYVGSERHKTMVDLGGKTSKVKTYADLVTSVINPSHRLPSKVDNTIVTADGKSRMRNYNEIMSVQELIDVVTFIESRYEIIVPAHYDYGY
jgi:sulfur-oxidizing protein SoxX